MSKLDDHIEGTHEEPSNQPDRILIPISPNMRTMMMAATDTTDKCAASDPRPCGLDSAIIVSGQGGAELGYCRTHALLLATEAIQEGDTFAMRPVGSPKPQTIVGIVFQRDERHTWPDGLPFGGAFYDVSDYPGAGGKLEDLFERFAGKRVWVTVREVPR